VTTVTSLLAEGQEIQVLAQVFAHLAAHLVGVGDQVVEGAVLGEPLHGGLGAALFHARHVVHRVADQGEVVDDALRRHAELGGTPASSSTSSLMVLTQRTPGLHELGDVLVAGGDHHLPAGARRPGG
jgi:hypothetical protein